METDLHAFRQRAVAAAPGNRRFLEGLKKWNPRRVDQAFHTLHDEVFAATDCLQCANCCKTTSPIFYPADVERAAKALRMKPGHFSEKYLRVDEDNDLVLKTTPCPFLADDNRCAIYAHRPRACRDYPHTNRKNMVQIAALTYKNTLVCPAVLQIVERLRA